MTILTKCQKTITFLGKPFLDKSICRKQVSVTIQYSILANQSIKVLDDVQSFNTR